MTGVTKAVVCAIQSGMAHIKQGSKRQNNTIYTFSIQLRFSSIGQDKSKLQKQISKLLILTEMAA